MQPKSLTGEHCLEFQETDPNPAVSEVNSSIITSLSNYDIFVLGKLVESDTGKLDAQVLLKEAQKPGNLFQFCQIFSVCNANQIDEDLSNLVSKIHFLLSGLVAKE